MSTHIRAGGLTGLLACLLAAGCMHPMHTVNEGIDFARQVRLLENHDVERPLHYGLSPRSSLYIAQSVPAIDSAAPDATLAHATYRAMVPRFAQVTCGTRNETWQQALATARSHRGDYLVYPTLVVWDDDVGNWTQLKEWWQRHNAAVQDPRPDPAVVTDEVRRRQQEKRAKAEAEIRRDRYYKYREAKSESRMELWEIRGAQAREKFSNLQVELLKAGENAAQWTHEQVRALTLWLRSRDYDELGRDQVAVRMIIADARTGEIVDTALLKAQSGWLTFLGDSPDEVMQGALQAYAMALAPGRGTDPSGWNRYAHY